MIKVFDFKSQAFSYAEEKFWTFAWVPNLHINYILLWNSVTTRHFKIFLKIGIGLQIWVFRKRTYCLHVLLYIITKLILKCFHFNDFTISLLIIAFFYQSQLCRWNKVNPIHLNNEKDVFKKQKPIFYIGVFYFLVYIFIYFEVKLSFPDKLVRW